jgi:hypothetical protein
VVDAHRGWIMGEVLATELTLGADEGTTVQVDGREAVVRLSRV